jgi:hypothetical protein
MPADAPACAICFRNYSDNDPAVSLRCTHHFHESCLLKWAENKDKRPDKHHPSCPLCRAAIFVVLHGPPSLDVLCLLEYTNFRASYLAILETVKLSRRHDEDSTDEWSPDYVRGRQRDFLGM